MSNKFVPKGPYAALLTPYNEDGTVCEEGLRSQVEFLSKSGIAGIFPCGTSGEFIHLSVEENCRVMDIVTDQAKGRTDVLPGTCSSNIETTLKLARHAEKLGCPAVVICPPYYITLDQKDVLKYFQTVARSINIGIILYNIPQFTNEISLETLQELMEEKNVVGIKDSSGNMKRMIHYIRVLKEKRPDFAAMTGSDDIIYPALAGGCVGSMTALSGIVPEINVQIYKAFYQGDHGKALSLQHSTLKLLSLAESVAFPAGYKLAAEKRGFCMGPSKQTVSEMGTAAWVELEKAIEGELYKLLGDRVKIK
jgi:dihydrodipicolinate synthase/N-acetylneuraminate lyase